MRPLEARNFVKGPPASAYETPCPVTNEHVDSNGADDIEEALSERPSPGRTSSGNIITSQDTDVYLGHKTALGGSRLDPFVHWPVNVTHRMRYLLDYGKRIPCL